MIMSSSSYANAPFNHAKADIILRSSDNIHFRVFRLFLSIASPFFETLFDIPQPAEAGEDQETKDGLMVVPVTETSGTLDSLLRFCYPCTLTEDPIIEEWKEAINVIEAARKYQFGAIEKKAIANLKILAAEPLRCFAIAHRERLREVTQLAAKSTLTQPIIPSWFQEIELITSTDLLSLLTYHKRCGDAVYALRLDSSWIKFHYQTLQACYWLSGQHSNMNHRYNECRCSKANTTRHAVYSASLQWWDDFMEETFIALRDKPCRETVQACAEKTVRFVKSQGCVACSPRISDGMRDFVELLARKVEETVSEVELELSF